MVTDLRLHYAPDNASLIVRLALEELGLPYKTVLVDRTTNAQKSASYRSLNPTAKIPTLETPDGPIFETAAILLYLADREGHLAPHPASPDRGAFLSWLFYLSNTMHANLRMTFYPQQFIGDMVDPTCLIKGARANITEGLHLLEAAAGRTDVWLNRPDPSLLDLYLAALLRWMAIYPATDSTWFSLANWPNLAQMAARLENRDSVRALIEAEGMAPHPFTQPDYPNPPEGVAL